MYTNPEAVRSVLKGANTGGNESEGTAAELSDDQIEREINNAASQINSLLSKSYKVPFIEVPDLIKMLTEDIAAYLCDLNYRQSREYESDNYTIIRRYNRAREMLEWLRTGTAILPITREPEDIPTAEVIHMYDGRLMLEEDIFGPFRRDW